MNHLDPIFSNHLNQDKIINNNNNNELNNIASTSSSFNGTQLIDFNEYSMASINVPSSPSAGFTLSSSLQNTEVRIGNSNGNGNGNGKGKGKEKEIPLDIDSLTNLGRNNFNILPQKSQEAFLNNSITSEANLPISPPTVADLSKPTIDHQVKKHWSREEDALLTNLVEKHGAKSWGKLNKLLGTGRTPASLTARWCRIGPKPEGKLGENAGNETLDVNEVEGERMSALINAVGSAEERNVNTSPPVRVQVASASALPTSTSSPKRKVKFTKWHASEDAELTTLVLEHGPQDWHTISRKLTITRTPDSVCGRWTNHLSLRQIKEGTNVASLRAAHPSKSNNSSKNPRWSSTEDAQLIALRTREGKTMSWAQIGVEMIPKRSSGSCRARWTQHLIGKEASPPLVSNIPIASTSTSTSTSALVPIPDFQIPHLPIPVNEEEIPLPSLSSDTGLRSIFSGEVTGDITLDDIELEGSLLGGCSNGRKRTFGGEEELTLAEEMDRRCKKNSC